MAHISKAKEISGDEFGQRIVLQPAIDAPETRRERVCGVLAGVRHWTSESGGLWTKVRLVTLGGIAVVTVPGETAAHLAQD